MTVNKFVRMLELYKDIRTGKANPVKPALDELDRLYGETTPSDRLEFAGFVKKLNESCERSAGPAKVM